MKINIKNLGYSFSLNILNALFPLMTLPFVFRAFTPDYYGEYVLVNIIYQIVFSISSTVLTQYFIREYTFSFANDPDEIRYKCGEYILIQLFFSFMGIVLYSILILAFYKISNANLSLASWFYIPLFFSFLNVDWYYYATQRYSAIFYRTLVVKSIILFLVFFIINKDEDIGIYAFIMAVSYSVTILIGFLYIIKDIYFKMPSFVSYKKHFFGVRHFFFNSFIGLGYQYIDQLILSMLLDRKDLAILNILKQIIAMLALFPATLCRYMLPDAINSYVSGNEEIYHKKYDRFFLISISFISVAFLFLGFEFLSILTGEKYTFSFNDVLMCSLCFTVTAVSVFIDTQYSIPQRREFITTRSNIAVLIVFLILLYPLIIILNYKGALVSMLFAEMSGVIVMILLHRLINKKHQKY
ncbi:hypothetical protein F9U41_11175 [Pectobacterium versatile]|nr:hypothetical protein [Pectobacterium versatile]